MPATYTLIIDTDAGSYAHPYHLGTDERRARECAEHVFWAYRPSIGTAIHTVTLSREGVTVDAYDSEWMDAVMRRDLAAMEDA